MSNFTQIGKKKEKRDIRGGNMKGKKKKKRKEKEKPHELYEPKGKTCTTVTFAKQ